MTVCIAAACQQGTKAVIATDRLLSYAGIVSDNLPGKMIWIDNWLVLYAGTPSNTSMIMATLREVVTEKITGGNVRRAFHIAYQRRKGAVSSFPFLSPYDMDLETFKKDGLKIFGRSEFERISQQIAQAGFDYNEQLLVVGWGAKPHAIMLYEVSNDGDRDHHYAGISAIGSGSEVALSTMMLLGQSRDSSLLQTLYTVAAAKFASEKSTEGDVGRKTSIFITWKRTEADTAEKPPIKFLEDTHVDQLYKLWNRYGRPRIPIENVLPANKILGALGISYQPTAAEANELIRLSLVNQADSAESK